MDRWAWFWVGAAFVIGAAVSSIATVIVLAETTGCAA